MRLLQSVLLVALVSVCLKAQETTRVSEPEAKKALVTKVEPDYPAIARQMKLTGRVTVDVYIDEDGKVEKVQPISGHQLLTGSTVAALKKWKFNSFGKKAVATFAFDFKL